jgi:4-amino-4-deoxychorismate lyase
MNRTRAELFGCNEPISIEIEPVKCDTEYRCKVIYAQNIEKIELQIYTKREIKKLSVIEADIKYNYKLCDRAALDEIFSKRGDADDVVIVRNGLIGDTTIANIAVRYCNQWLTPKTPLLNGTMRARLLDDRFLVESDILATDLNKFEKIAVMNALRGFEEITTGCLVYDHQQI